MGFPQEKAEELSELIGLEALQAAADLFNATIELKMGPPLNNEHEKGLVKAGMAAGWAGTVQVLAQRGLLADPDSPVWEEYLRNHR